MPSTSIYIQNSEKFGFGGHDDSASHQAVRREFKTFILMKTLRSRDRHLCSTIENLYDRTIDFGGHPNERAVTGSMEIKEENKETVFMQIQLHGDSLSLDYALKTTAQIGLGSLCIFQMLFKERFQILGLNSAVERLRAQL